jgi:hypothetical protein
MPKSAAVCCYLRRKCFWRVTAGMSLGWIAAGVVACLFAMIALMPPFDGEWDS